MKTAAMLALSLLVVSAAFADEVKTAAKTVVPVPVLEETIELRVLDAATVVKWLGLPAPGSATNKPFDLVNGGVFSGQPLDENIAGLNGLEWMCGTPRFQSSEPDARLNPYRYRYSPGPRLNPYTTLPGPISISIESVKAIEGRNAVLVRGSREFIDAVRRNVEPLDKPSQTVIFDAVCYKVKRQGKKNETSLFPEIALGVAGSSELIRERIATFEGMLPDAGAQRFDLAPRMVQDGQMACIGVFQEVLMPPAGLVSNAVVSYLAVPVKFWRGFQITPAINGDGTFKLVIVPVQVKLESDGIGPDSTNGAAQTIATGREGETLLWELKAEPSEAVGRYRWFLAITPRLTHEPKGVETPILENK